MRGGNNASTYILLNVFVLLDGIASDAQPQALAAGVIWRRIIPATVTTLVRNLSCQRQIELEHCIRSNTRPMMNYRQRKVNRLFKQSKRSIYLDACFGLLLLCCCCCVTIYSQRFVLL